MSTQPLILARSIKESHVYAQALGLEKGKYRIIMSPSSISAVRGSTLFLVPGWETRYDRFAMRGALRYCHLTVVDLAGELDFDFTGLDMDVDLDYLRPRTIKPKRRPRKAAAA